MHDGTLTGLQDDKHRESVVQQARWQYVHEVMNEIDTAYGRTLGCRIDPVLREYVKQDNHMFRKDKVEAFLRRKANKMAQMQPNKEATAQ